MKKFLCGVELVQPSYGIDIPNSGYQAIGRLFRIGLWKRALISVSVFKNYCPVSCKKAKNEVIQTSATDPF